MSKTKQIWEILFPNGIWYTYYPCAFILCILCTCAALTIIGGSSDWLLLMNCICITSALRSFYSTYKIRARERAHEEFMRGVMDAVRPQLKELHNKKMPNGFDPIAFMEMSEEGCKIINAEVKRRKNLDRVSKTGKP